MYWNWQWLVFLGWCIVSASSASAQATWRVATILNIPPTHPVVQHIDRAYQQIGLSMRLELMAAERATTELKKGQLLDATIAAGLVYGEQNPDLIRIPVPVYQMQICAFGTDVDVEITTWQQLEHFSVLFIQGQMTSAIRLQALQHKRTEGVLSMEQALRRVALKREHFAVLPCAEANQVLKLFNILHVRQHPPLETVALYHYIHQKHRIWVKPLTEAIQMTFAEK